MHDSIDSIWRTNFRNKLKSNVKCMIVKGGICMRYDSKCYHDLNMAVQYGGEIKKFLIFYARMQIYYNYN
jgi:hypothetical protein